MRHILKTNFEDWNNEVLIRKSKWIFFFIVMKMIFSLLLIIVLAYLMWYLLQNNSSNDQQLKDLVWVIILILMMYFFSASIIWFIRYFFDVIICTHDKVRRVKLWLFYRDNIDVIELYRVQEMEVVMDWFFRILFNVWDICLIEQNDMKKIIHWIDSPKKVVFLIQDIKDTHIRNRHKVQNRK